MRSYGARLAKLERALLPQDNEIHIQIVYFDDPGPAGEMRLADAHDLADGDLEHIANGNNPPGKRVKLSWGEQSPAIDYRRDLHKLAPVAVVAPGLVESLLDDAAGQPSPAVDSSPTGAATTGTRPAPVGEPEPPAEKPWDFRSARWMYSEPPAGPGLQTLRKMARKAARADERRARRR